jgi:hypothetical protein
VRKRAITRRRWSLKAWTSAHVYLGLSLIVIATLHTGFQFGWNVHTLAYVLMMLVIASGAFGVYTYIRYPALMTGNRRGMTAHQLLGQIATTDGEMRQVTMTLPDAIASIVARCLQETEIGGSTWRQLSARYPNCATEAALGGVRGLVRGLPPETQGPARQLLVLLQRKSELLRRIRNDVQFKAIMEVWLYIHVPISFALLAALLAHIISVFFYW